MPTPLCILIVDDSRFFLTLERQFLRDTPATVVEAQSVDEALQKARELQPSLVYMDIDMPAPDGLAGCRRFKADPQLKSIPIILLGDAAQAGHEGAARAAGCDAYLPKPLDRRQYLALGHGFLNSIERREPRRQLQISVIFVTSEGEQMGQCMDISSGGMFLASPPFARKGDLFTLDFLLPAPVQTRVVLQGQVAWLNLPGEEIKPNYPPGYGIQFVDIDPQVGIALRRCFG